MQCDLASVLSRPAFDKPIRNQTVDQPDRSGMRQAKDPPQLVVGHALAVANDDECRRGLAAAAYDLARALLNAVHDRERQRSQQIRNSSFHANFHAGNNMCAAHKKQLDLICVLRTYLSQKSDDDMEDDDDDPERSLIDADCQRR